MLRCGEEEQFMKMYWQQIVLYGINVISLYNSVQCLPILNYYDLTQLSQSQQDAYARLYKLVAIDISFSNSNEQTYANYLENLNQILKKNLSNEYRVNRRRNF
jgi:hypothetical protein